MSGLDLFLIAVGGLLTRGRRTLLSLLGVSIGVAAVLLLTGLGQGVRDYVDRQFLGIGSRVFGVVPGKVETSGAVPGFGRAPNDLTIDDAEAIRRRLSAALTVAPMAFGNDTISSGDRSRQILVLGSTAEMLELRDLELRSGSFLPEGPWDRGSGVVVLGLGVARELFGAESPVGRVVRIGSWRMRVIGVLGSQGVHFGIDMDETVFIPVATAMAMFDESSLARIGVEVRGGADLGRTVERCRRMLIERHGEEDFTILTPDAMLDALSSILTALTLGVAGIGAISLAVAGIGIMNVMLVSVSERTSEVGLMKAVGASRSQVVAVFLAEAVLLSALGGVLGVLVGLTAVHLLAVPYPALGGRAPLWAVGAALGLALACGAVFGVLPARRAAQLDPVVALSGRRG